jgi:hypothetical protein
MCSGMFASMKRASLAAACAILLAAPCVNADMLDQRSVVTFNASVAIPGGRTLAAGAYVFKMSPLPLDRDTVQIFDAKNNHLIATLETIPVWLQDAPDQSMVLLSEGPAGGAPTVHEFVYAGSPHGHEFIY